MKGAYHERKNQQCAKILWEKESRIQVLKGIDCEINDGEICVLLGPSGSGKSTLLNIIGGLKMQMKDVSISVPSVQMI